MKELKFTSEYMNLCHLACKSMEIHRLTPVTYFAPINVSNWKTKDEICGSCTMFLINVVQGKIILRGDMNGCTVNEENEDLGTNQNACCKKWA